MQTGSQQCPPSIAHQKAHTNICFVLFHIPLLAGTACTCIRPQVESDPLILFTDEEWWWRGRSKRDLLWFWIHMQASSRLKKPQCRGRRTMIIDMSVCVSIHTSISFDRQPNLYMLLLIIRARPLLLSQIRRRTIRHTNRGGRMLLCCQVIAA
jgi:hypothetical protein